jgi:hypothetical protein
MLRGAAHLLSTFALLCCPSFIAHAQSSVPRQSLPPEVIGCEPCTGAVDSVLKLTGYRLVVNDPNDEKIFFIQGDASYRSWSGSSRSESNDSQGGRQELDVNVPEGLKPGPCQIVIEVRGRKSAPVVVEIAGWTPPLLDHPSLERAMPGDMIWIYGSNFHVNDEIELTDALGRVRRIESGAQADSVAFQIKDDTPEGPLTVRVGNRRYGNGQYTPPLVVYVTRAPLPLVLWPDMMRPVAPGQWFDLVYTSGMPLEHADRVEVEFSQGGRQVVAPTLGPRTMHVRIPPELQAGDVRLRTRTWRGDVASDWSKAETYKVSERRAAPVVEFIRIKTGENTKDVGLWPGPDKPEDFEAKAGETLFLHGQYPVADVERLAVRLDGPGGRVVLPASREGADSRVLKITLPESLQPGGWRLTVVSSEDNVEAEVPVVMRVE